MASLAWQVTLDDIENVLESHALRVENPRGQTFAQMAEDLISEIDEGRVEKAALAAGSDMDEQTQAALDEIKKILVEMGVIEF
jgi:isochorismate synthase EntC